MTKQQKYARDYREAHREELNQYFKEYRLRNLEKLRERGRENYRKHRSIRLKQTRAYAKAHPEQYREYVRRHKIRIRSKHRAIVDEAKGRPCMDCQRSFPPICMDLDHRPGEQKSFCISDRLVLVSEETLREEIEKCDLVCACCHRLRTQKRQNEKRRTTNET